MEVDKDKDASDYQALNPFIRPREERVPLDFQAQKLAKLHLLSQTNQLF